MRPTIFYLLQYQTYYYCYCFHHVKELRWTKRLFYQVLRVRTRVPRGRCLLACAPARGNATNSNNFLKELSKLSGLTPLIRTYYPNYQYRVELRGFEPRTPALQRQCSSQLSYSPVSTKLVGLGGLEPPTSRLSGVRSNHLSYKPP